MVKDHERSEANGRTKSNGAPAGIEPTTLGLKGPCSPIELPAHAARIYKKYASRVKTTLPLVRREVALILYDTVVLINPNISNAFRLMFQMIWQILNNVVKIKTIDEITKK